MVYQARLLFFIALLLGLGVSLSAQSSSSLIVTVTDPNGDLVAGAPALLTREPGFSQKATASDLGVISYRGLPAGKFSLTITVHGFEPHRSDVELKPGETKRVDLVLQLAVSVDTVDVSQDDAVDPTGGSNVRSLEKREIETLPDDPDELRRVLQSIAGPTITGEEMPISVNGIPGATLPNKENIKLVRINRNVFSAQHEYTYGGGIEIFTSSDIKKISGYVGANFSDARLNATNPFIGRRVPSQMRSLNWGFAAPLGRTASVSVYSSVNSGTVGTAVNAYVLDQNYVPVQFRGSYDTQSFSSWNSAYFNWDPNKQHKFVGMFDFGYSKVDNADLGGFSLATRANRNRSLNTSLAFTETYIITPDFVNTTRFYGRYETNRSRAADSSAAINVSEAFLGGGSQVDREATNSRVEIFNDTTRKFGRLNVGFGVMVRAYKAEEVTRSNFGGTYTFSGRTAPVLDSNLQPVRDAAGNIVTTQITSLESYRRTLLLGSLGRSAAEIRSLGGGADQFTIAGGRPDLSVSQFDYSLYQQNSFGLTETTGLSFGLRYENQTRVRSRTNFAPRFGFTWAPKAKEKQRPETTLPRVTLGYGFFYNRFAINYAMNELVANSPDRAFYFITDPAVLDLFPAVPSVAALEQSVALRSLRLIDDEIQTPFQKIASLNITKSLWKGVTVNAGYTRTHTSRSTLTRNINAPLASALGSTEPPVYPFGNSRSIYETRSEGRNRSDRIFVSANLPQWKVFGKPIFASVWYSFAKVRNDVVSGSGSPFDPYDFSREWGPSPSDGQHVVSSYFNLSLPKMFFIRGDVNFRTGTRFNIITGRDTNRDGIYAERPSFASDPTRPGVIQTPYGLLDPNPGPLDAIIPRNLARGPMGFEANLYFSKTFGFDPDKANKNAPRKRLSFGVWVNNVFNRNNRGNPIGNMSSPNFLQVVSSSNFDGEFRPSNPRRMQFSTSFSF